MTTVLAVLFMVSGCEGSRPSATRGGISTSASATYSDDTAELAQASTGYVVYVKAQVTQQVTATRRLDNAVRAGNIKAAAAAYPAARVNYERIEPVAESFGLIDPDIDARIADVLSIAKWTGYHRLERAIFRDKSLTGMVPIANKLDADVRRLNRLVHTITFAPAELGHGATALLDEVERTKITGEEEAYSNIDLVDFQANVDGAHKAFDLLTPALTTRNPTLTVRITTAFSNLDRALRRYRTGNGPTDFQTYTHVPPSQRRALSNLVLATAEPLSQIAGIVTAP